jgi:CheY-like chemotaxis protein
VDDGERNRKLACDVLRAAGIRTLEASTAGKAIELAVGRRPDVILMDIRLPDMEGTDAVRVLREHSATRAIPVVALSSLPNTDEWFVAAGFDGYLEKPFDVHELVSRVRSISESTTGD